MLKALMKKQLVELFQTYFVDRKTGKARGRAATTRLAIIAVLLFVALGYLFFCISAGMGTAVLGNGVDWLYFAVMALAAMTFGVFGSVFNTYASLYLPKDNDLLMSLPIPTHALVLSRVAGVYATSLLYSAWIWIPAVLAYFALAAEGMAPVTAASVVACLLLTFVLALFVAVLACLLGWVVALIASKAKGKSFVTVLCSLAVLGIYWLAYFRLIDAMNYAAEHIAETGSVVQSWLHYSCLIGFAAQGDLVALLLVTLITAALGAGCFFVLVKSFGRIATSTGTSAEKPRKEKAFRAATPRLALLKRELDHFASSPTWMLNCGFGLLLLPVGGIAALVMQDQLRATVAQIALETPGIESFIPVLLFAALATVVSVNAITCAAVSLEGKSLWVLQSLPVSPWEALRAKASMAALLNGAAVLFATITIGIALGLDAWSILLVSAACVMYAWLHAYFGLTIDLCNANLSWTDDSVPVKRSISTLLSLLGGWAFCGLAALAGYFLCAPVGCAAVLIGLAVLAAVIAAVLRTWLKTQGARQFATL